MAISKVTLNGETLMDVTGDTVAADNMLYGITATAANGNSVTGTVVTTPVDSTLDVSSSNAIQNQAVANALTNKADVNAIPSATSDLSNNSYFVADSSYVHTDNNFTTTLKNKLDGIASSATVDDHKWNTKGLVIQDTAYGAETNYIPMFENVSAANATLTKATRVPTAHAIPKYNADAYLVATTPSTSDNSTLVATTAFVNAAIAASGGGAGASIEVVRLL